MKKYFLIIVTFFAFVGCKKNDLPVDTSNSPVFEFDGTIGGDSVNYVAGVNGVYMFTGFYKDSQNLMTLKSSFAPQTCENCEPSLIFEVKDIDTTNTNSLSNGIINFVGNNVFYSYSLDSVLSSQTVETFEFISNQTAGNHIWDFGDGSAVSNVANPTHVFNGGGLRTITHVNENNGNVDSISNTFNTDISSPCRLQFNVIYDSVMNQYYFNTSFSGASQLVWNFGNGTTGSGNQDSVIYNNQGIYLVSLSTNTPTCGTLAFNKRINTTAFSNANASYDYISTINTSMSNVPRLNKSAFIITWKNNGKVYKSFKNQHGINQSGNPIFTMLSFAQYDKNEKGNKTIKLNGSVDTYLYNQSAPFDSIKITSRNLVVAAAYPD